MGVPLLFKTFISTYDDILLETDDLNIEIDTLYLDLNCAIHPCCQNETNENKMIQNILDKIRILTDLVKAKTIFIAIDGVPPKAKMLQQRYRRYKSSLENKIWDTNAITPGTIFMNNLNKKIHREYCDSKFIISDSSIPGEGNIKSFHILETIIVKIV